MCGLVNEECSSASSIRLGNGAQSWFRYYSSCDSEFRNKENLLITFNNTNLTRKHDKKCLRYRVSASRKQWCIQQVPLRVCRFVSLCFMPNVRGHLGETHTQLDVILWRCRGDTLGNEQMYFVRAPLYRRFYEYQLHLTMFSGKMQTNMHFARFYYVSTDRMRLKSARARSGQSMMNGSGGLISTPPVLKRRHQTVQTPSRTTICYQYSQRVMVRLMPDKLRVLLNVHIQSH